MIFKLGHLITLLFVTMCIATSADRKGEPFSVENVYINSGGSSECKPAWLVPIQKYYDETFISLSAFPSQVSEEAIVIISTFRAFLTKIIEFSTSKSKLLSSGATAILESFAQVRLNNPDANAILDEFNRLLPIYMNAYRKLITNMTKIIGHEFVSAVNTGITDLELEFKRYMEEFEKGDGNGRKVEVDYEPVMKRAQKLVAIIALKGDVKIRQCQLNDPNVQDALVVLNLVLDFLTLLVRGVSNTCKAAILEQNC